MAKNIFQLSRFEFPYSYRFPGQGSDEKILFVTRENKLMLYVRALVLVFASVLFIILGWAVAQFLSSNFNSALGVLFELGAVILGVIFFIIGWWWISSLWKKSIVMVTNKRLCKFVYTTPASRYSLSLPLEMIVDTGAYTKGFLQTFLQLGTLTARSSAASSGVATDDTSRINKKYFYIENVAKSEDLQQYINKLLTDFRRNPEKLDHYRPFIPHLKGEARKKFLQENFPQYSG